MAEFMDVHTSMAGVTADALAAWHQVFSQTSQKTQQHAAGLVIHRVLNGRAGTRR